MPPAPPLTQFIGRTERTLRALMDRVLADTGGTFPQYIALNFIPADGGRIDRSELLNRLAGALKVDDAAAGAVLTELADEGLLEAESDSVVALTEAGRERYARIRAAVDRITAPLFADIPADDEATTRRVLTTISGRADAQLART
jgi:DNA-binding MarR family transcriptional regulator